MSPVLLAAGGPLADSPRKLSAVSLLPDGSQLHGVMFPRYDEQRRLVGVLKAEAMTLVNEQTIAGDTVVIEFFNPDRSSRGRVDLTKTIFNQSNGTLEAMEPVTLQSDRMSATGLGLVFAFEQSEGFLIGPVTTWIKPPPQTAMKSRRSPLHAAGVIGLSLLAHPLTAAPPPSLSDAELAAIRADAAPRSSEAASALAGARQSLAESSVASAAASKAAQTFLVQADIPVPAPDAPSEAKPLDVKPGPNDTVITSDGGMYFDADEGVFVYMKNVRVKDPRFDLSGANELKIFIGKKPANSAAAASKDRDKSGIGLGAKFGDVERIVANGAVLITQKEVEQGKEAVEASGAVFTYNLKSGEIVINGGFPWVKQGATYMRAKQPNLILRIQKNGSFVTEGNWEMGGNLDKKP